MFEPLKMAPSVLSADFANLGRDVRLIEEAGAAMVHVDVMDGHFVPNLSMGVTVVNALKRITSLPLAVHLMIDNPLLQLPWFLDAGADAVTVHMEALNGPQEVERALEMMHAAGARAALSIKPATPPETLDPFLAQVDMVLVMSVEPGFSGQSYLAGSEDRVARVVELARRQGASPLVQVDGGIGKNTAARVAAAGADVLVCGNAVFGAADPARALVEIAAIGNVAREQALVAFDATAGAGVEPSGAVVDSADAGRPLPKADAQALGEGARA